MFRPRSARSSTRGKTFLPTRSTNEATAEELILIGLIFRADRVFFPQMFLLKKQKNNPPDELLVVVHVSKRSKNMYEREIGQLNVISRMYTYRSIISIKQMRANGKKKYVVDGSDGFWRERKKR